MTGGGSAAREAQRAREEQEQREARIAQGTRDVRTSFADQFNTGYYQDLGKSVKAHYAPDLNKQYQDALKQMHSALMGRGLDNSSIGLQQIGEVDKAKAAKDQDIAETALNVQNAKKQDIINAENTVIQQLQNSGDAGIAMSQAYQQAAANASRPGLPLLGSVFQDVTAGLATQAQMENQGTNRYNVFNRGGGANRYMRNVGG